MKKTIILSVISAFIMNAAIAQQDKAADEQAIRNIVTSMQTGWNSKDGKKFASGFAPVHNYIVINGMYLSGITPEMNAANHQGIFNSIYKTTDLLLKIDKISFVTPDLALVYILGATYQQGTPIPENPTAVVSMVIEKKNKEWKTISFHNVPIQVSFAPDDQARTPFPPKQMYASWYKN